MNVYPVVYPGFPNGHQLRRGCQLINWPVFHENCMKMKKFWAGGGRDVRAPPRPITVSYHLSFIRKARYKFSALTQRFPLTGVWCQTSLVILLWSSRDQNDAGLTTMMTSSKWSNQKWKEVTPSGYQYSMIRNYQVLPRQCLCSTRHFWSLELMELDFLIFCLVNLELQLSREHIFDKNTTTTDTSCFH